MLKAATYFNPLHRLATVLLLLLMLALLQISSNGVVRGGDENEGSGIGGTGRTLSPLGESGIGGTGIKPYLGMNADNEIEILHEPTQHATAIIQDSPTLIPAPLLVDLPRVERVARVIREIDIRLDSTPLDISEIIQMDLDVNAKTIAHLAKEIMVQAQEFAQPEDGGVAQPVTGSASTGITWDTVAKLLGEKTSKQQQTEATVAASSLANLAGEDPARFLRPERVQRPELPPIQRISPLQRSAILPPRVLPMRL